MSPGKVLHREFSLQYEYECVCVNQVMAHPDRLSKTAERVVEDFCWVQWDGRTQRLYYLTHSVTHTQACTTRLVRSAHCFTFIHKKMIYMPYTLQTGGMLTP